MSSRAQVCSRRSSAGSRAAGGSHPRILAEVIARLNREVASALAHPDVKKRLLDLHIEAKASTPEQLGALLTSEVRRWGDVITRANIPRQ